MNVKNLQTMSSLVSFDLTQKQYEKLIQFLNDNNGKHIINILEKGRDDEYIPPSKEKIDKYDYTEGSASEEELMFEVDDSGFFSLR